MRTGQVRAGQVQVKLLSGSAKRCADVQLLQKNACIAPPMPTATRTRLTIDTSKPSICAAEKTVPVAGAGDAGQKAHESNG